MGEILRRPKRRTTQTIEFLTHNRRGAPNKEDLRRRHNALKKELVEKGFFEELEDAIRHQGRHLLARFRRDGWESPPLHLHQAAEIIAEASVLSEEMYALSKAELADLELLCAKGLNDISKTLSPALAELLPRLLRFGRELHRMGLSGITDTYELMAELSKK
jgi:hypothetical protein